MEDQVIKNWNSRFTSFLTEEEVKFNKKQIEDQQNGIKEETIQEETII